MNFRLATPSLLVDLNRIGGLADVGVNGDELVIQALVRHVDLEVPASTDATSLLLARVAHLVGHLPIRMRGTFAGSLAHADPAAEWCMVAAALDATIVARSVRGTRRIPASEFFDGLFTTALEADEIITEVRLPLLRNAGIGFREKSQTAGDFATVATVAACSVGDEGVVAGVRLALAGAASTPVRAKRAESLLVGKEPTPDALAAVARAAAEDVDPDLGRELFRRLQEAPRRGAIAAGPRRRPRCCIVTSVTLEVNGRSHELEVEPRRTLADVLREDLGLHGTHLGCEHGVCGACTVLLDGAPTRACLVFAVQCSDSRITTIEGLASDGTLHPVQHAFIDNFGLQCGFCTPGFIMLLVGALEAKADRTEDDLVEVLASNLCRCTGYRSILEAAKQAAGELQSSAAAKTAE